MKKFLLALLLSIFLTSSASAYMTNWGFDPDGAAGPLTTVTIPEYLNIEGNATITNNFSTMTFTETGTFSVASYGSPNAYFPVIPALTAEFTATGRLTPSDFIFDATLSALTFYDNGGTKTGVFDLLGGGGSLNTDYGPSNGQITLNFVARELTADYWFDSLGNDLSALTLTENSPVLVLGFATTNASIVGTPVRTDPTDPNSPIVSMVVSNNGQFRVDIVPEPGTMILFGLGLLGFAGIGRRRANA